MDKDKEAVNIFGSGILSNEEIFAIISGECKTEILEKDTFLAEKNKASSYIVNEVV